MHVFRISVVILFGLALFAGLSSFTQSSRAASPTPQAQQQIQYEYGVITTRTETVNDNTFYVAIWHQGIQEIAFRSRRSMTDSMRQLSAQLGGGNNANTNLSVLLNSVGRSGWRLVETTQNENGTVRTFIRVLQ